MALKKKTDPILPAVSREGVLKIADNLYIDLDARTFCSFEDGWIYSDSPQDKDFEVLSLLASTKNKVFSRDLIIDRVWLNDPPLNDRCVDRAVTRLRAILRSFAPSVNADVLIDTKKGVGYQFCPECYEHFPSPDAVFSPAAPEKKPAPSSMDHLDAEYNRAKLLDCNGDYEQSMSIHFTLDRQGYAPSINYLGVCYCRGEHLPQFINLGIEKYRAAAELDYPAAYLNLGDYHMNTELGEFDPEKAVSFYRRAAAHPDAPDADAMYRLHLCLKHGIGTDRNPAEAESWRAQAMERGVRKYANFYQVGLINLDGSPLVTGDHLLKYVSKSAHCRLIRMSTGEELPLYDALTLVGSDPAFCRLLLTASSDSRHALLRIYAGQIILTDLCSSSGTSVNEKRLPPLEETILYKDDIISFGSERFQLSDS